MAVQYHKAQKKAKDEGGNHLCGPVFGVNCSTESTASIQRQSIYIYIYIYTLTTVKRELPFQQAICYHITCMDREFYEHLC